MLIKSTQKTQSGLSDFVILDTNSTLIFAKSGDGVVGALVVALVVLPALQIPKKAQGSMRSFGTPPKAKVRLAKMTSTIFMMQWQNELKC